MRTSSILAPLTWAGPLFVLCSALAALNTSCADVEPADSAVMPLDVTPVLIRDEPVILRDTDPRILELLFGTPAAPGPFRDWSDLPPSLDELVAPESRAKLSAVMRSFTIALGTNCGGCHIEDPEDFSGYDFYSPTPNRAVAFNMWSKFVKGMRQSSGAPIYCDTCHQDAQRRGRATFLNRSIDLKDFMKANFARPLMSIATGDGNRCETCHGPSFDRHFLDAWRREVH